jgi:hypothetical protein
MIWGDGYSNCAELLANIGFFSQFSRFWCDVDRPITLLLITTESFFSDQDTQKFWQYLVLVFLFSKSISKHHKDTANGNYDG